MFILVLNSTNIVPDGNNNKLVYKFPNSVNLKDKFIAVVSISMYYSWFNITSIASNNYFTYTWTSGAITTTYNINIPDGLYDIVDINNLIQYTCIQNGTYWIDASGANVYPFDMILNPPRYAIQLNTFLVPIALPVGASVPLNFAGWPGIAQNPVITIPQNFNLIIGFSAGFVSNGNIGNPVGNVPTTNYQSKNQTTGTISYISTSTPQVQPNNNVLFSMSGVNNPYTQPSSIIYSINPNVNVGEQITITPPNYAWVKFIEGTYNELRLSLLGNDLSPLSIKDPNMTILLAIRDKEEAYLGTK